MLKKEIRDRPREKKAPVNRKLLIWLFILTGLVSFLLWWRGKVIHGGGPVTGGSGDIRWVIEPTGVRLSPSPSLRSPKLLIQQIERLTATASGTYAIYVYHLDNKTAYGINEKEEMPGASLMKIPVLITTIQKIEKGELKFEERYTLEEADRSTGSGPLQFKPVGTSYTIDELLTYLGKNSDNTAWVMFNRRFGKKAIQQTLDGLGLSGSDYDQLTTTATDVAKMWEYLYAGKITETNRERVWGYLTDSIYEDRIPAGLVGTGAQVVGHKVGTDAQVWADAGIISCQLSVVGCRAKPLVMVILNKGVKRVEATEIVPRIAQLIWKFENNQKL